MDKQAVWFRLATAVGLAAESIRAHKLRSALTLLGIVVGVGSVVLVGAAIEGLSSYAGESTARAFGTESFQVAQIAQSGRATRTERAAKLRRNKRIRVEDLEHLRAVTGDRILYSPYRQRIEDVKRGERTVEGARILGVSAALAEIREIAIEEGRFLTEQEERTRQSVCVIGDGIRSALFPGTSPLNETVRIRGLDFKVVGVEEKLGSVNGQNQDEAVYVTHAVFTRLFGPEPSIAIFGRARPETGLDLNSGLDLARAALRTRFKVRPGAEDNFDTLTPDSIRGFVGQILGLIAAVVVPVTGISLVVGGIVVMNIMLVSVTERTREIGIRKSLGARRADIQLQFLTESVMLAAGGGLIGLALGWAGAAGLSAGLGVALPVTGAYVILALLVSSLVGILSGWYPARRAARMDPVEALRAE
jgi:putative ABC transport system permease protein